jgi:hypothetical protein
MKKIVVSLLAGLIMITSSFLYADFNDVLGPTVAGAAIGGVVGGGRGAGIGAGVGFGIGLMNEASRDRHYYREDYRYSRPSRFRDTYDRTPVYQQPYYDRDMHHNPDNFDPMD